MKTQHKLESKRRMFNYRSLIRYYSNKTNENDFKHLENKSSSINFVFVNQAMTKKELENILDWMFRNFGLRKACLLAEFLKEGGFKYATQGGISINLEDLKVPTTKQDVMITTQKQVDYAEKQYDSGAMTISEWFQKRISAWNIASETLKSEIVRFFEENDPLNPLYIMSFSGARGNLSQVRQLIGMRGLMSDQKGEMIGAAIQANFREGLSVIDFLISSYGARKGLVDTSIRTADSGHMTRRLVDAAHNIIICQFDCRTLEGLTLTNYNPSTGKKQNIIDRLIGRVLAKPIINPKNKKLVASRGQEIDNQLSKLIEELEIGHIQVRSPLTCESYHSVCQMCFGWDPIQPRLVEIGEAIGIIAAQSIGEPGTQLTMRTFHTGGVFSRELSEQIRSEVAGQVKFPNNLKTKFIRTLEGDFHQLLETTSFIEVLTYENQIIRIPIDRDHILTIKNREYIRRGQVIINVASFTTEDSETEIRKTVLTPFAGEIYYQPREKYNFFEYNFMVWLLAGDLFTLPATTKLSSSRIKNNLIQKQSFGYTNFVARRVSKNQSFKIASDSEIENISSFCSLKEIKIARNKNRQTKSEDHIKYLLLFNNKNKDILSLTEDFLPNFEVDLNLFCLGRFLNSNYQLISGGNLINLSLENLPTNGVKFKTTHFIELDKGGTVAWLNEDSYLLSKRNSKNVAFYNGKILKRNEKAGKRRITNYSGFLKVNTNYVKGVKKESLSIQTASIYFIDNKKYDHEKIIKYFNGKFFFPGEKLLNRILIKEICYCEVFSTNIGLKLVLRPIIISNILHSKHYDFIGVNCNKSNLNLSKKKFLTILPKQKVSFNQVNYITESGLFLSCPTAEETTKKEIFTNFDYSNKGMFEINFSKQERFSIKTKLPDLVRRQDLCFLSQVKPSQTLEPYTVLTHLNNVGKYYPDLFEIRSQYSTRYQKILIIDSDHIRTVYTEEHNLLGKNKLFTLPSENINNLIQLGKGGKLLDFEGVGIRFRLGKPYLFTEGAKLYRNHGDLLPVNTVLGFVTYKIFKTQDITQGLPKVEEIFEARRPESPSIIAKRPCLITKINQNQLRSSEKETGTFLSLITYAGYNKSISENINHYSNLNPNFLETPLYDFINLGERLEKGKVDPHELLEVYFDYYCYRDAHHKACLRSLYRIASIFLHSIQSVYKGQGINIADRQLEVILRQMTRMGIIYNPGDTPLLDGEFLELTSLDMLNSMLYSKNKRQVYYRPTIIGLTKVALHSEGFLSASSFQETTRVLTQAAIEGKRDWLRGLKENVITGRLIPVGSGLANFADQWMAKNVFLYGRTLISKNLRQKILDRKKKRLKTFKINSSLNEKDINFLDKQNLLVNRKNKI